MMDRRQKKLEMITEALSLLQKAKFKLPTQSCKKEIGLISDIQDRLLEKKV